MLDLNIARQKLRMLDLAAGDAPLDRKTHVAVQDAVLYLSKVIEENAMIKQQLEQAKTKPEPEPEAA